MDYGAWIGIGGVVAAAITAFIAWRKTKPEVDKLEAETARILVGATEVIVKLQEGAMEQLQRRVAHLEEENKQLRARITELENAGGKNGS
jgi:predicted RNase H-like nuclease (RuvC/YqgF family)